MERTFGEVLEEYLSVRDQCHGQAAKANSELLKGLREELDKIVSGYGG